MSKPDRRIRRTQEALRRALFELILDRGFEAVTVSEIAERADVGRSTFYKHYADKEDLLQGAMEGLKLHLEARVEAARGRSAGGHPALAFCLPMLEHAAAHKELFGAMSGRRGGVLVQDFAHDIWVGLIRANWKNADELAVQAIAGAFGSAISWWLFKAPALTPFEVEQRFRAFIEPLD